MIKYLILIVLILTLVSCSESENNQISTDNSNIGYENEAILSEIRKEPKVKEVILTDANVIYVSVLDDGTNRNGYAQYICEILREYKTSSKWVKVVKFNSTDDSNRDNAYGVLLGEAHCE